MKSKRIVQLALVLVGGTLAWHWDNGWVLFWSTLGAGMLD